MYHIWDWVSELEASVHVADNAFASAVFQFSGSETSRDGKTTSWIRAYSSMKKRGNETKQGAGSGRFYSAGSRPALQGKSGLFFSNTLRTQISSISLLPSPVLHRKPHFCSELSTIYQKKIHTLFSLST